MCSSALCISAVLNSSPQETLTGQEYFATTDGCHLYLKYRSVRPLPLIKSARLCNPSVAVPRRHRLSTSCLIVSSMTAGEMTMLKLTSCINTTTENGVKPSFLATLFPLPCNQQTMENTAMHRDWNFAMTNIILEAPG
ncbi:hypothetical protein FKM82_023982 [Ascaphus truei]